MIGGVYRGQVKMTIEPEHEGVFDPELGPN
jgi:hypothetical protein